MPMTVLLCSKATAADSLKERTEMTKAVNSCGTEMKSSADRMILSKTERTFLALKVPEDRR